jgi:hypothetical protein
LSLPANTTSSGLRVKREFQPNCDFRSLTHQLAARMN